MSNKVYLSVVSRPQKLQVALFAGEKWYQKTRAVQKQDRVLLATIVGLLQTKKLELEDIHALGVYLDPELSFTSLRVTLSTLNTLAWSLNIPLLRLPTDDMVKGVPQFAKSKQKKFDRQLLPPYSKPAHITKSKKRTFSVR